MCDRAKDKRGEAYRDVSTYKVDFFSQIVIYRVIVVSHAELYF